MSRLRLFEGAVHADLYLKFRPTYSQEVFRKIMSYLCKKNPPPHTLHVDVACGSGQGTYGMTSHFKQVVGFDISAAQVEAANKRNTAPNVEFKVSQAENLPIEDASVDLITCGSAAHWLDFESFYKECRRVLKPNGCLAVHCYSCPGLEHDDKSIQKVLNDDIHELRYKTLGHLWSERQYHVVNRYADIKLPFQDFIRDDTMELRFKWSLSHLMGYFLSWSASQNYLKTEPSGKIFEQHQNKVLDAIAPPGASPNETIVNVVFPFFLLMGRNS